VSPPAPDATREAPVAARERTLVELRPALLRMARVELGDLATAEDVVSETLLVLLQDDRLARADSPRAYAMGVLRHKIVDHVRRVRRLVPLDDTDDADDAVESAFDGAGHWHRFPAERDAPDAAAESDELARVLDACVEALPQRLARVFLMREWLELEAAAICEAVAVKPNNLHQLLFRARFRLRECLEARGWGATR
jgi:RNA polymerase sigma-70 factor (ECF subfamily)